MSITRFYKQQAIHLIGFVNAKYVLFRLCLVGVKRFPENTYFPEMLISGKGKCFHGVWLHFKKFSGKYFLVFGKEEGKHKSEKHKPQIQENTNPE